MAKKRRSWRERRPSDSSQNPKRIITVGDVKFEVVQESKGRLILRPLKPKPSDAGFLLEVHTEGERIIKLFGVKRTKENFIQKSFYTPYVKRYLKRLEKRTHQSIIDVPVDLHYHEVGPIDPPGDIYD